MNRRLEGPRLDIGKLDASADSLLQAEAQLEHVMTRRRIARPSRDPATSPETMATSALEGPSESGAAGTTAGKSLDDILQDFIMPVIPEPAVLRRSMPILEHFMHHIVPTLEGGEQLKTIATTLLAEEIERLRILGVGRRGAQDD